MAVEASLSKPLYKIELYLLKVIPMIMAVLHLASTTLFYFGIDLEILSYLGGVSFLTLGFLYLSSYVFKFCEYYRMFLHYIVVANLISIYDTYIGIPVSDDILLMSNMTIAGIFLFLILYLKKHEQFLKESCN
ncbi:MAG: hypothetical protein IJV29_18755 [Butyrivibrio sp.]|nr:hypothetical protein [Butyrivibrio sp.]MBQ7431653.1 hypothetical protein [Butyrivibrio sp.]